MALWVKDREGQWVVIARENEVAGSTVIVRKKNGETQTVNILSKSKPFIGKYGEYAGKSCVFVRPGRKIEAGYVSKRGAYFDGTEWFKSKEEYERIMED